MPKRLYIETVGCQMNMLDSELVVAALRKQGYELADTPRAADTILFNTCSVRQHAEDKIYSALGRLKHAKRHHPHKIIGVIGCMAQKDQQLIFDRAPYVDLIVGPGQLHQIPRLLEEIAVGSGPRMEVSLDRKAGSRDEIEQSFESYDPDRDPQMRPTPYQAFVRIQIGCDKFCTYCIVPSVRGPEQGRDPAHILAEARKLAAEGCREITLLGQTVNSYQHGSSDGRTTRLADLLHQLHEIEGLARLKFVTSYPKDMTDELLRAVRDLPKCSPYLHAPAQSGANTVLRRMKRGYTVEDYREMLQRIRATVPGSAVTSDFIVGFCGETEDEFQQTIDLVRESRFKNSFIFKYSPRPGTKGAELMADDVPEEIKRRRNNELLAIQNEISEEDNQPFIGRVVEILVEGPSKHSRKHDAGHATQARSVSEGGGRSVSEAPVPAQGTGALLTRRPPTLADASGLYDADVASNGTTDAGYDGPLQLTGRTHCDRIVVFDGQPRQIGQLLPVTILDANAFTLFGAVVTRHVGPELFQLQTAKEQTFVAATPGDSPGAKNGAAEAVPIGGRDFLPLSALALLQAPIAAPAAAAALLPTPDSRLPTS